MFGRRALMIAKKKKAPYTKVAYLTGNGTQYINTGVVPTSDTKISIGFSSPFVGTSSNLAIVGARISAQNQENLGIINYATTRKIRYDRGPYITSGDSTDVSPATYYEVLQDNRDNYLNNVYVSSSPGPYSPPPHPIFIFCIDEQGYPRWFNLSMATLSVFFCTIWINGIKSRDLIPVLDGNQIPCMYDRISKQFFYNQGTGKFGYA